MEQTKYKYKITKTYSYYGHPQAKDIYKVESRYLTIYLTHYGNQGYDIPDVQGDNSSGYFWRLNCFLKCFYSTILSRKLFRVGSNETYNLIINEEDINDFIFEKI